MLCLLTVAVPLALWITAIFLAEDRSQFFASTPQLAVALAGLLLVTCIWSALCIFISAACATPNSATVAWCMLIVGSSAIAFVLSRALRESWLESGISVWGAGGVVVRAIAGVPQRGVSVTGAVLTLTALFAGLALLARRRLRLVEAIA